MIRDLHKTAKQLCNQSSSDDRQRKA